MLEPIGVDSEIALAEGIRDAAVDPADTIRQAMSAAIVARLQVADPRHFVHDDPSA